VNNSGGVSNDTPLFITDVSHLPGVPYLLAGEIVFFRKLYSILYRRTRQDNMSVIYNAKMRGTMRKAFTYLFLSLFPIQRVEAQQDNYSIRLKSGILQPEANAQQWLEQKARSLRNEPQLVLLQFQQIPDASLRAELAGKGIKLMEYVDGRAYTAMIAAGVNPETIKGAAVRSITDMQTEWKAEPGLWKKLHAAPNKPVQLIVSFDKGTTAEQIRTYVSSVGGVMVKDELEKLHCYKIEIEARRVSKLADWYAVLYMSPAAKYVPLDMEANAADGVGHLIMPVSQGGRGLSGAGVAIGVGDNSSGITHIDVNDRVINYNPVPYGDHGTQTSGMAGGAGNVDPKGAGVARGSTIINFFYDHLLANSNLMRDEYNMTLTNNSYAAVMGDSSFSGVYDVYAQALEQLTLDREDVLHVFAAGNDGNLQRPPYPAGYGSICGGYQTSKNTIVVSNNTKNLVNWGSSSRGPVRDGRLKPEASAVGTIVTVLQNTDGYVGIYGGTSMASPQVAGVGALLTERYRQINGNVNPRSDLLKALILNATTDLGNSGPDFAYGFGFLNARRSLEILDSGRFTMNNVGNGGQQNLNINVPAGVGQLKVMLVWNDKVPSLTATRQLVNDLDLEVVEPSAAVHKPLVLNKLQPNVLDPAVEARDSLNNTEQVTINNPPAGSYTIRVKGYNVPVPNQNYTVAYDWVYSGIELKSPVGGTAVATGDSLCIYWEASPDNNPFTLEFSTNNGGNWTVLDNNIAATKRQYTWFVPNVSSEQCLLRISRNTTSIVTVSDSFVIAPQPVVTIDSNALCPGYIKVKWNSISNATGYNVMRKLGPYMQTVATVVDTFYTFSGLSVDSTYYIAVEPLINGKPGYRSLAVKRKPDNGNCTGNISDGDLMVEAILQPESGRQLTSTQLSNNETITVRVRNLDDVMSGAYTVHYAVNGNWQSQNGAGIPANGTADVNISGIDLSTAGIYSIVAAIDNTSASDNVSGNDTVRKWVRNLNNAPVTLGTPYTDGFETIADVSIRRDSIGISGNERWDYSNDQPLMGQLRSEVNDSFVISNNRSVTMDRLRNDGGAGTLNLLTGTFNLATFDTASDEIRIDFDYMLHGKPKFYDSNEVWLRGSDTQPWITVYHYDTSVTAGVIVSSGSISATQALKANGQNFSSSFQVRFGQKDTSLVASKEFGNGMTLDNFRLYTLQQDMQLLGLLSPVKTGCDLAASLPVTIKIYNSVSQVQSNTQVNYQLNNNPVVSETIATIAGSDTIDHTFTQAISNLPYGNHTLSVWLSAPGDDYLANDSVLNIVLHNQPLIDSFPFLENFEANDGYWYQEGYKSSWEYGTPSSTKISGAFSGSKAWKTNLDGYYNSLEQSYLYTTCFDISGLDTPMLSFKLITDIENCGNTLCDIARIEYSTNAGQSWSLLGGQNQGVNWYNVPTGWSKQDSVYWVDATLPLPASAQPIRFRYELKSDPATEREGMGIDDFRIYEFRDTTIANPPADTFQGVEVYPNPNNHGYILVKWSAEAGKKMEVMITDVAGKVVYMGESTANAKVNISRFDTGRFSTGIYVVKVIVDGGETVRRVLFN
jgi:hypothetical protein